MLQSQAPIKTGSKRWKRSSIVLAFCGLLIISLFGYYFTASWIKDSELLAIYEQMDQEDPRWRWQELIADMPLPPDEKNALLQVEKVHKLLEKKPFNLGPQWDHLTRNSHLYRNARLNEAQEKLLRTALSNVEASTRAEAHKLKDMPEGRVPIAHTENPYLLLLPQIQNARAVMNLLQNEALLSAQEQKLENAAESCQALLNTVHAINDHPTLIASLVRMAGQHIAVGTLESTMAQGEISSDTLKVLQGMLEKEAAAPVLYYGMRGERAVSHQFYMSMRAGKSSFSDLYGTSAKLSISDRVINALPTLMLGDYANHLRLFNEFVDASKLPDKEREDAFRALEEKTRVSRNMLSRMLMPSGMKVTQASQRAQGLLRSAILAVAAERFRRAQGHWPEGSDELVKSAILRETVLDPYDGKPLRWRRTGSGLILYSIGMDRIDDGGKLDRNKSNTAGTDLGFELWDPLLRHAQPIAEEEPPVPTP